MTGAASNDDRERTGTGWASSARGDAVSGRSTRAREDHDAANITIVSGRTPSSFIASTAASLTGAKMPIGATAYARGEEALEGLGNRFTEREVTGTYRSRTNVRVHVDPVVLSSR